MPIRKPHLQIHTSYFDQETNSIFKDSLRASSEHSADLELDARLNNSKSQPGVRDDKNMFQSIYPVERSPHHQHGPESQQLLQEFRQIVDATPQIKSEQYQSLNYLKSNVSDNQQDISLTRAGHTNSNGNAFTGQTVHNQDLSARTLKQSSQNSEERYKRTPIQSLMQSQEYILSVNGISQYQSAGYPGSNKEMETSFLKNTQKIVTHTVIAQELDLHNEELHQSQNKSSKNYEERYGDEGSKKGYEFVTRGYGNRFREFSADSKLLQRTNEGNHRSLEKSYGKYELGDNLLKSSGNSHHRNGQSNQRVLENNVRYYEKSESFESIQVKDPYCSETGPHYGTYNPNKGIKWDSEIQLVKGIYSQNLQQLRTKIQEMSYVDHQTIFKTNINQNNLSYHQHQIQSQRIQLLRDIWHKLNSPHTHSDIAPYRLSTGKKIKLKLNQKSTQNLLNTQNLPNTQNIQQQPNIILIQDYRQNLNQQTHQKTQTLQQQNFQQQDKNTNHQNQNLQTKNQNQNLQTKKHGHQRISSLMSNQSSQKSQNLNVYPNVYGSKNLFSFNQIPYQPKLNSSETIKSSNEGKNQSSQQFFSKSQNSNQEYPSPLMKKMLEQIQALKKQVQQLKIVQESSLLNKMSQSVSYVSSTNHRAQVIISQGGQVVHSGQMTPIKKLSGNFFESSDKKLNMKDSVTQAQHRANDYSVQTYAIKGPHIPQISQKPIQLQAAQSQNKLNQGNLIMRCENLQHNIVQSNGMRQPAIILTQTQIQTQLGQSHNKNQIQIAHNQGTNANISENHKKLIRVSNVQKNKQKGEEKVRSGSLVSTSNESQKVIQYYPYSRKLILKELQDYDLRHSLNKKDQMSRTLDNQGQQKVDNKTTNGMHFKVEEKDKIPKKTKHSVSFLDCCKGDSNEDAIYQKQDQN